MKFNENACGFKMVGSQNQIVLLKLSLVYISVTLPPYFSRVTLQYDRQLDFTDFLAVVKSFMEFRMIVATLRIPALCLVVLAAACPAFAQTSSESKPVETAQVLQAQPVVLPVAASGDERYRIGYQDTLEIQIFRHPELSQRIGVNSNGTINLFRISDPIVAVCKTERELASDVADAYRKDYLRNPEVNVVAVEQRSQAFAVIGAVEKPGTYLINRKVRLLELLAQAGGPSKEAGSRLTVTRTGSTSNCKINDVIPETEDMPLMGFTVKDVLDGKKNLVMRPGDIVSVLKSDVIYVYGNVNKQGQIEIKEPITLTQAIASSEGLKPSSKKNIRILRQKPDSLEREELIFDFDAIDKQKIQDPYLQPNDVVAVSEDGIKSILRSIGRSLTTGLPSILYRVPL